MKSLLWPLITIIYLFILNHHGLSIKIASNDTSSSIPAINSTGDLDASNLPPFITEDFHVVLQYVSSVRIPPKDMWTALVLTACAASESHWAAFFRGFHWHNAGEKHVLYVTFEGTSGVARVGHTIWALREMALQLQEAGEYFPFQFVVRGLGVDLCHGNVVFIPTLSPLRAGGLVSETDGTTLAEASGTFAPPSTRSGIPETDSGTGGSSITPRGDTTPHRISSADVDNSYGHFFLHWKDGGHLLFATDVLRLLMYYVANFAEYDGYMRWTTPFIVQENAVRMTVCPYPGRFLRNKALLHAVRFAAKTFQSQDRYQEALIDIGKPTRILAYLEIEYVGPT